MKHFWWSCDSLFPRQCVHDIRTLPLWIRYEFPGPGCWRTEKNTSSTPRENRNLDKSWARHGRTDTTRLRDAETSLVKLITNREVLSYGLHLFTSVDVVLVGLPVGFHCLQGSPQDLEAIKTTFLFTYFSIRKETKNLRQVSSTFSFLF